jgi:hypothetical protein
LVLAVLAVLALRVLVEAQTKMKDKVELLVETLHSQLVLPMVVVMVQVGQVVQVDLPMVVMAVGMGLLTYTVPIQIMLLVVVMDTRNLVALQ